MTATERELAEAALEKLDHAVEAYEYDEDTSVYREAGALAKALRIIQARKPETKPRSRKPLPTPEEAQAAFRDEPPTTEEPAIPPFLDRRQTP